MQVFFLIENVSRSDIIRKQRGKRLKSKQNRPVHGAWADGSSGAKGIDLFFSRRIQRDCRTDTFDFFGRRHCSDPKFMAAQTGPLFGLAIRIAGVVFPGRQ